MNDGLTELHELIDKHYSTYETLKRKYGIVKKVLSYEKAIVTIEGKDLSALQKEYKHRNPEDEDNVKAENGDVILLNMTNEELKNGDSVWIHYWTTITSGYIAIKNGTSKSGSYDLTVDKLAVLNEEQKEIYAHAKRYSTSSEWGSDFENEKWQESYDSRTMNIDRKNDLIIAQGEYSRGYNVIFANGNPVIIFSGVINPNQDGLLINPNLRTHEMNVKTGLYIYNRQFTETSVTRSSYRVLPSMTSKIFLTPTRIRTTNGQPVCYYGLVIECNGIEDGLFSPDNDNFSSIQGGLNLFSMALLGNRDISDKTTLFEHGSVSPRLTIYNIQTGRMTYNISIPMGFQSDAEYEYAKCVLSTCDYQRTTGGE